MDMGRDMVKDGVIGEGMALEKLPLKKRQILTRQRTFHRSWIWMRT